MSISESAHVPRRIGLWALPFAVLVLTGLRSVAAPSPTMGGTTYYVAPLSTDCASTAGSGTINDPWRNLYNALTTHPFNAGDVITLRGGTYRSTYHGFGNGCNMAGDQGGVNSVLPLSLSGSSDSPIVIQNYEGETVILDGTDADFINATWTACGTASYQLNGSFNVGSARTAQVWVNPSGAGDAGRRLAYDPDPSGCAGMKPGTFRFNSAGTGLYVRLADSTDANLAQLHVSCESGDCAPYVINDAASTSDVTVRKNPDGGAFWVKYGYYSLRVDNNAQHLTLDGIDFLAAGGRDYGSCVRVFDGDFITVKNGSCRETAGEGLQFYGGGPGGSNGGGIQITHNVFENMTVSYSGFAWVDGGGIGNNLGFGVIIKNCTNCSLLYSRVSTAIGPCVQVTTSTDVGETDAVTLDGNDIADCGYVNLAAGNRTRACISVEPQRSALFGAVRNGSYVNNACHNEAYGTGATWPAAFAGGDVSGLSMSDAGKTAMTGNVVVNNSFDQQSGPGLNLLEVTQPVTFANNAFGSSLATGGNVCNGNGRCSVMATTVPHVHENNAYWAGEDATQVVYLSGARTFTRATATEYEPSAVQTDPLFTSAGNFRLKSESALIDAGTNTFCPATDAVRFRRPSGPRCDVGAFEFNPASRTPPSPQGFRIIKK